MFLHKRNRIWYIHFVDTKGKRQKVSTKSPNRLIAEKYLRNFFINSDNSFINKPLSIPQGKNSLRLLEFSHRIIKYAKLNYSNSNIDLYQRVLKYLIQIAGNKTLESISISDIEQYKSIRVTKVTKTSVNIELRAIRAIFNIAKEKWELLDKNPAKNIQQFGIPEKEKLSLDKNEIQCLLNNIDDKHFKEIVLFGLYTGCRASEIINLEWNDIDLINRIIVIRNKPNFKTKTGKMRQIPINHPLFERLCKLKNSSNENSTFVFLNKNKVPYRRDFLTYKFKKSIKHAGLPNKYHFHCLRHSFITSLIQNNISITKVMKLAGHSEIETTLGYTHLNVEDLRDSIKMIQF